MRCFSNGAVATLLIYFYYRSVNYEDPIRIPLSLAFIIFTNTVKSILLKYCRRLLGDVNIIGIAYLFFAYFAVIANDIDLSNRG